MHVEPFGLPAALKAWRNSEPDAVLILRCGAAPDCGAQVGAVYRSPQGVVVESRISVPATYTPGPTTPFAAPDLQSFADGIGVVGILDEFDVPGPGGGAETGAIPSEGAGSEGAGGAGSEAAGSEGAASEAEDPEAGYSVRAQIDLTSPAHYWHDPAPVCPQHGVLRLDRLELVHAVRRGEAAFEATPA